MMPGSLENTDYHVTRRYKRKREKGKKKKRKEEENIGIRILRVCDAKD